MPNTAEEEIIDLTKTYSSSDLVNMTNRKGFSTNLVIDLVNDVFYEQSDYIPSKITIKRQRAAEDSETAEDHAKKKSRGIGHCSICWDELGSQQLASTKCGHVFCLICLKASLKRKKQCPTCRCVLKGTMAYHPLFLPLP